MARVLVFVRLLPADDSVDIGGLLARVGSSLPEGIELLSAEVEPYVFGINVVNALFKIPDEEGCLTMLEEHLKGFEGVGEIEVVSMSRVSS